ncbi:hypothetical protein [Pelagibacterium xiamenense]|uniref:hypothetical protein n=1 Tax=Pelagibacterium xiamenense TaxID=2901140 RepID=UPI001E49C17C|nr:hypothetical protein [Pelagibacterium xiamenense]MCD7059328.1 hypothetical protein [Pelagibacterium xiamenense]
MARLVLVPFALVLLIVGAILAPTPIPFGIPMVALALFILIGTSKTALRLVRRTRRRWDWLDDALAALEQKSEGTVARTFKRSRPTRHKRKPKVC